MFLLVQESYLMNSRLNNQLSFIKEIDKLKSIDRMSLLINSSRRENTAEHSWHFALMVSILAEHAESDSLNLAKTIRMALIHDIVEIDAGDTYCYDEQGYEDKSEREITAAKRIFGLLPDDQGKEIWQLWEEFEEGKTEEAKFARAIDRLNPFMLNYYSGGKTWRDNKIKKSQVLGRMGEIEHNTPKLWPYVTSLIDGAIAHGWIIDDLI